MNLSYRSLLSAGTGLAVSVGSIGLGFIFTQPVFAGTKLFTNQKIVVKADGSVPLRGVKPEARMP